MSKLLKKYLLVFFCMVSMHFSCYAQCGLDIFIANDQSGSIDAVENSQGRGFITTLMDELSPWGTANNQSRMAIAQWAGSGQWEQFNFPTAGVNYTTLLSDVIAHQNSPRIYSDLTDPYQALLKSYQVIHQTPVAGRTANKILILMTDVSCGQIQPNIANLATQIKDEGIYVMVLAIDAAQGCTILQGENVASPGGYFSAPGYAELYQQALAYIDSIIQRGCIEPPPPTFDLTIDLTSFTATNCEVNGPGTYSANYTIHNAGLINWNHPVTISFYDGNPTLPGTKYITRQALGVQSIAPGGNMTGSLSGDILRSATRIYAIVNFDGSIAANAPPLPVDIKVKLLIGGERSGRNNISNGLHRISDPTCLPRAVIKVDVQAGDVGCDNTLNYAVELCNTGDATAYIDSILPGPPHPNFVLQNSTTIADSTLKRIWGTYYGGSFNEEANSICTDSEGNIYIGGSTKSNTNISTPGSHKPTHGGEYDAFLVKFNSNGVRQWATYYGDVGQDYGMAISTDAQDNVYLTGYTGSVYSISTPGSHQRNLRGSSDAFLVKFNSDGIRQWGTYYGGNNEDYAETISIDKQGYIYIAGSTTSTNTAISTPGSHQETFGGVQDAFLVKFDSDGIRQWGTFYGGADVDVANALTIDNQDYIYITGATKSTNAISTPGSHQASPGGNSDAFLLKFNSSGILHWATYYGGEAWDRAKAISVDANCNIYIAGGSESTTAIATAGSHQDTYILRDAFLVKFDSSGVRQWATYYGGTKNDDAMALSIDAQDYIYMSGATISSSNISTPGAYDETFVGNSVLDAFLVKFNNNGIRQWGTYYGGSGQDMAHALNTSIQGYIYMAGYTSSDTAISTIGSHQETYTYFGNAYLVKFGNTGGIFIPPNECKTFQYTYTYNNVPPGTYNFSVGVFAQGNALILPDSNFTAGGHADLDGFNGAVHPSDNISITGNTAACPVGDQVSVAVSIPAVSGCGGDNYVQATVTINNTSGVTLYSPGLQLTLSGTGASFAGEPYNLSPGLLIPSPNVLDPAYPNIPYALYGKTGGQSLPVWELPPGTSTFQVDILLGTSLTNLAVLLNNIPTHFNSTGQSNTAADAQGVTISAIPTISGFSCPASITAGNNINFTGLSTTNATAVKWASSSRDNITNGGSVNSPSLVYTPTGVDIAKGFVAISLTATNAAGCETTRSCQINITNVTYDYGDAPVTYDLDKNAVPYAGASTLLSGIHLGTQVPTTEAVAKHGNNALGDGTEEDGLDTSACAIQPIAGQPYELPIIATNTTATNAYASAFIDFNNDGDYLDDNETMVRVISIPAASNTQNYTLPFIVPLDLNNAVSQYFVRLRISTDSNAIKRPYGPAPQGEVEDHLMKIGGGTNMVQTLQICQGDTIKVGSNIYTASGTYRDTLSASGGCDSIITTNLTVTSFLSTTIDTTICQGQSISVAGNIYSTTGNYKDTLSSSAGCDSIITTNLTVNSFLSTTIDTTICQGQSISVGNSVYTLSGSYTDTLSSAAGCDSIITINLTVNSFLSTTIDTTICQGQSIAVGNSVYTLSGSYANTLSSSAGCDSVVTLTLTVLEAAVTNRSDTICMGESIVIGGSTFDISGDYTIAFPVVNGCDSLVNMQLTVLPLPSVNASAVPDEAYFGSSVQLLALPQDAAYSYNWSPAHLLSDPGIYNPLADITSTTWFVVTVADDNGCSNSDSIRVKVIDDCYPEFVYVPTAFSPNGDNTNDCFGVLNARDLQHFHLSIFNRWHEKVFESFDQKQCWDGSYLGQPAPIDVYVFQISFTCHNAGQVLKRGVLTLLR